MGEKVLRDIQKRVQDYKFEDYSKFLEDRGIGRR